MGVDTTRPEPAAPVREPELPGVGAAPGLAGSVACLWTQVAPPGGGQATLVLPDACSDLIWQSGRGPSWPSPDTGPWPSAPAARGRSWPGRGCRPGAGGPALGLPLSALLDQRVEASDLGTGFGARLARLLGPRTPPAVALRLLAAARCAAWCWTARPTPGHRAATAARPGPRAQAGDRRRPAGRGRAPAAPPVPRRSAGYGPRRCGGAAVPAVRGPGSTPGRPPGGPDPGPAGRRHRLRRSGTPDPRVRPAGRTCHRPP